ncbi:retinitis pigmentosa 9 protein [Pelomyxa schiedti]|nr:retinitis pigmentosa 9 protein [Pelomyxa schiedti]
MDAPIAVTGTTEHTATPSSSTTTTAGAGGGGGKATAAPGGGAETGTSTVTKGKSKSKKSKNKSKGKGKGGASGPGTGTGGAGGGRGGGPGPGPGAGAGAGAGAGTGAGAAQGGTGRGAPAVDDATKEGFIREITTPGKLALLYEPPPGMVKEEEERPEDCIPDTPENQKAREFLARAPTKGLWMPLGQEVKVMQCWRCKNYGHRAGDRECKFFQSGNLQLEQQRKVMEDPMTEFLREQEMLKMKKAQEKKESSASGNK